MFTTIIFSYMLATAPIDNMLPYAPTITEAGYSSLVEVSTENTFTSFEACDVYTDAAAYSNESDPQVVQFDIVADCVEVEK